MTERDEGAGETARVRMTATALKEAAQEQCDLALATLTKIMQGEGQDSVRLAAAREMLDRAHGKPKPPAKPRSRKASEKPENLTVIVKRFSDITPEEEAAAEATERGEL